MEKQTLADALPKEIERVHEIIREYESLPSNAGMLAATLMKQDIKRAHEAMLSGDLAGMISAYQALKEYEM